MTKPRENETDQGIQGLQNVSIYDRMQRRLRDKGWIETRSILRHGITAGYALEIGSGPGYLGLEWLKCTKDTLLKGVDISADMVALAERNATEYGLSDRAAYVLAAGSSVPFGDGTFDAVFSNGSLHEWSDPQAIFKEIGRVLKEGGRFFISDLRRDMAFLLRWFLWLNTKPREIRPGLVSSINAAYTPAELQSLVSGTALARGTVRSNPIGVVLSGIK